jgi:DNA repair and recombination protein RAD52
MNPPAKVDPRGHADGNPNTSGDSHSSLLNTVNKTASSMDMDATMSAFSATEAYVQSTYQPPGAVYDNRMVNNSSSPHHNNKTPATAPRPVDYVRNPTDRSVLMDHHGRPITVDRLLATKPLQRELSTRPGPGNRKMLYLSGEGVTRTLNDIFGYDGWNLDIRKVTQVHQHQDTKTTRWNVSYMAHVRITHCRSGTYKEDMGAGDSTDKNVQTAIAHALKASITDALKRAARHFGDKLGNSLYQGTFTIHKAPKTLADALDQYDTERAHAKFGIIPRPTLPVQKTSGDGRYHQSDMTKVHNSDAVQPSMSLVSTVSNAPEDAASVLQTPLHPSLRSVTPAPSGPWALSDLQQQQADGLVFAAAATPTLFPKEVTRSHGLFTCETSVPAIPHHPTNASTSSTASSWMSHEAHRPETATGSRQNGAGGGITTAQMTRSIVPSNATRFSESVQLPQQPPCKKAKANVNPYGK